MLRSLLKHAKFFQLYKLHCKDYFSIKFKALGSNAFESLFCFKGCFSFLLFSFLLESTLRAQLRCYPLQSLLLYYIIFFNTTVGWLLQCFPFEIICFSYNLIHQFCAFKMTCFSLIVFCPVLVLTYSLRKSLLVLLPILILTNIYK